MEAARGAGCLPAWVAGKRLLPWPGTLVCWVMVSPAQDPSGDPVADQYSKLKKLKRQLDELVDMTTGLEDRLKDPGMSPEERRDLRNLKTRYAREALEMMMKIDCLEDPEDLDDSEEWDEC